MTSDFCVSTLSKLLEPVWNPIERQIFYLIEYRSNLETLRRKGRELDVVKTDNLRKVDDAKNRDEEIMAEALDWLAETVQIEMDIEWLEERIEKAKGQCLHKYKLDWRTRHRLSKFAKKKTIRIDEHLPKGRIETVSFPARHADLTSLPTSDFIPLESSLEALNSTMEALKTENRNINVLGVYGSGGIGKTELMKQVVKKIGSEIFFDKAAFVTVTAAPDLRRIQDEIANYLGSEIEGGNEHQRAATLSQRLKNRGRVLIILDDLWQKLNLAAVGIPYGEEHRGCKVIVTSRSEKVCNEMECSKTIPIPELTDEDRKKLFKIKAQLPDSTAFDRAVEEVVRQCGKVANSIIIIGTALRNQPVKKWNNIIKEKKESTAISVEGISEEVVLCVTLGYDQLEQVDKDCLQFSCLFPPYYNVSMDEIAKFGLVDELFPNVHSLGEVRNQMHQVVTKLKFSNLLLKGDREGCYKIHDDTRKVVKFISLKEGNNFIAEAGLKKGWPEDNLQNCEKLSLMDSNIAKLPDRPRCPKLLTLFLQNNALEEIPSGFFQYMRALRFLDLSYTNISSLPSSFECLEQLRSISLENTHLRDASLIKEFSHLEVLTLKGSSIEQLPTEIGDIVNLKVLDLTNNIFLKGIPCNVIAKLVQLEELYIGNSFGDWEIEGTTNQRNAGFSEVASLARLTVLYIHVKNTKLLSIDFDGPWTNLKKFRVCVNDDYWEIAYTRSMHLKNLSSKLANWVKFLLEKAECITLTRSVDLEDIGKVEVYDLSNLISINLRACSFQRIFQSSLYERVQNLEELHVEYCYSMQEVFHLEEIDAEEAGLKKLEELILVGLPKILTIWKGNHSAAHLENLKLIKVKECEKLRSLLPKILAQKLHKLEHLAILKCDSLEEIVSNDHAEGGQNVAQELNTSSASQPMVFQNLQKLRIYKCNKMKSVLSLAIVQGLKQLKELNVASCKQMEGILMVSDEEKEAEMRGMFPGLKILVFKDLPKLDTICNREIYLDLHCLEELQVWKCPNIKRLPLDSRSAPNLGKFRAELAWFEGLQLKGEHTRSHLKSCLIEEEENDILHFGA